MSEWVVKQKIQIPFKYTPGQALARFLLGLRECRIWASQCDCCGRVYVPALGFCGRCWQKIESWRDLPAKGELLSYTILRARLPEQPHRAPVVFGLIRLDEADSNLVHVIGDVDPAQLGEVVRVHAVWREQRQGSILDISHFAPDGYPTLRRAPDVGG